MPPLGIVADGAWSQGTRVCQAKWLQCIMPVGNSSKCHAGKIVLLKSVLQKRFSMRPPEFLPNVWSHPERSEGPNWILSKPSIGYVWLIFYSKSRFWGDH